MPLLDIKITALEALKPFTTRSFTESSLIVSTCEHSMSLSHSFLQMKAENQKFLKMKRIWLENWHLRSRINLWCKHKFTNVVLSLCWQMSKLTVWHFRFIYIDQNLRLEPSTEKRSKQSCTPHKCLFNWLQINDGLILKYFRFIYLFYY